MHRIRRVRWTLLWTALTLSAVGCAGLGKPLETPRINLANIQVEETTGLETAFTVQLRVFNPNEKDLQITGINCDLELNDRHFATGVSKTSVTIPSYDSDLVAITFYSNVFSMIRSMMSLPQQDELSYRLKGKLRLGDETTMLRTLPFRSEGTMSLEDFAPGRRL